MSDEETPKLGNQEAFDVTDFHSLVQLMKDVQQGHVSCRRAAVELQKQINTDD